MNARNKNRGDMKRIYVAGLFSRNAKGEKANTLETLTNMRTGIKASIELLRAGYAVFCPWLDFQFGLSAELTEMSYKNNSMAWLEAADAVLVISGKGLGTGVDAEIERANELHIPVFYSIGKLIAPYGWENR